MVQLAANIWADGPPSAPTQPFKPDIRAWGTWVEGIINAFTTNGGLVYTSRAALFADLAHAAPAMAWVLGDAVAAYNGVYAKLGISGSGSWSRIADLPYSFIVATDVGNGTANAIQAASSLPISSSALVVISVFEANTASPLTVQFNGGAILTIKTNTGNDIVPGGVVAGMKLFGYVSGSTYQLISDQVAAAIVSAAELAEAGAVAAQAATVSAMSSVVPTNFSNRATAMLYAPTVAPDFMRLVGYYTPGDFGGGLYKKVASQPTHAGKFSITLSGGSVVWYEISESKVTPQMFGAKADSTNIGVGTDDTTAIENCLAYWKIYNVEMELLGCYRYSPTSAWDLTGVNRGAKIVGRNKNFDGFNIDTGKGLAIEGANNFYLHLEHFKVLANYAGPALRIGKNDFSDAFNGCKFILTINNNSLNTGCSGLCLNYVLASDFFCTINLGGSGRPGQANAPGFGKALWLRQASFNRFMVACGQANIGIAIETGASFSNQFEAIDIEEVDTSVAVFSPTAANNLFLSGQIVGNTCINCTDGRATVFDIGCNIAPYSGGAIASGKAGLEIKVSGQRAQAGTSSPAMPASTVAFQNTTGSKRLVHIWAGAVTLVSVTSVDGGVVSFNPQVAGEGSDVVLHPNWSIALTYTSAPSWRWFPL